MSNIVEFLLRSISIRAIGSVKIIVNRKMASAKNYSKRLINAILSIIIRKINYGLRYVNSSKYVLHWKTKHNFCLL